MDIKLKYSYLIILLGLLAFMNLACSTSVEAENEMDSAKVEPSALEEVVKEEKQEIAQTPIVLSEEQFRLRVMDFMSNEPRFKGEKPCAIDFYADWCRPCKILAPIFEKMAGKYGDKVNFYKVNVDYSPNISAAYGVTSIPTLFFYDRNGTLYKIMGLPSEEELENTIKAIAQ